MSNPLAKAHEKSLETAKILLFGNKVKRAIQKNGIEKWIKKPRKQACTSAKNEIV